MIRIYPKNETVKNDLILINCVNPSCNHEFMLSNNSSEITNIIVSLVRSNNASSR